MSNSSVSPIDRTRSGATKAGLKGSGSDGNEGVLCIPQSSSITGVSTSDGLIQFTNPSARARYDTKSIFKRSLTGLNWREINWIHAFPKGISAM